MKTHAAVLVFLLLCPACFALPPKSKGEFSTALRQAFETQDLERLHALTWSEGVSDLDIGENDQKRRSIFSNLARIEKITFEPAPAMLLQPIVTSRMRSELSYKPSGVIMIVFKANGPGPDRQIILPYAVIDGAYYLVIAKVTKLEQQQQGEPDNEFSVMVLGKGMPKVKTHIKFNVAGVDQERDGNWGFSAQYISEVTVVSKASDVDVTLTIFENGKKIYESKHLKGWGHLIYKNGDVSP